MESLGAYKIYSLSILWRGDLSVKRDQHPAASFAWRSAPPSVCAHDIPRSHVFPSRPAAFGFWGRGRAGFLGGRAGLVACLEASAHGGRRPRALARRPGCLAGPAVHRLVLPLVAGGRAGQLVDGGAPR